MGVALAIADLEGTFGVKLLDRTSRGVEPTIFGEALMRRAVAAFDELKQGSLDIAFLADSGQGELRIEFQESLSPALVAPLIPPAKRGGRPRSVNLREVLNAIFYVLWTGCQWTALPTDLPPRSTVWDYLDLWDWDGTLERIHHALYVEVREQAGREASPTTAIIDSQTARGAVKGGLRSTRPAMTLARRCSVASATC